eukprot:5496025-Amphidinium_carterae.1
MALLREEISVVWREALLSGSSVVNDKQLPPPQLLQGTSDTAAWKTLLTQHFANFYDDHSE